MALQHRSGPIPDADQMEKYAKVDPSFPQQIFDMALTNQNARIEIEKQKLANEHECNLADIENERARDRDDARFKGRGQLIGAVVILAILGFTGWLIYLGEYLYGIGLLASNGVIALVYKLVVHPKTES